MRGREATLKYNLESIIFINNIHFTMFDSHNNTHLRDLFFFNADRQAAQTEQHHQCKICILFLGDDPEDQFLASLLLSLLSSPVVLSLTPWMLEVDLAAAGASAVGV